jgi:hypothetical protein
MQMISTIRDRFGSFIIRKPYLIITFIIYCACVFILASRHEPWADEAQAWLIARDSSLFDLIINVMKYEGSPSLWQMLLMIPAKCGLPFKYINLLSVSISALGVYIFLRYSPFNPIIKVLLPFTYFIFYQYSIIARSYVLLPLLLFILASFYKKWDSKFIFFAIITGLLGNVSFHAAVFSGFIFLYCIINILRNWGTYQRRDKGMFFIASIIYGMMMLIALYEMIPASDCYFAPGYNSSFFLKIIFGIRLFSDAFFSNYATGDIKPWLVNCYQLSLVLLVIALMLWFFKNKVFLLYIAPTACLLLFYTNKYVNVWHIGLLFLYFIFVLWVSFINDQDEFRQRSLPEKVPIRKYIAILRPDNNILRRLITAGVIIIALIQIKWSVKTSAFDFYEHYSGSPQTAEFLKQNNFQNLKIAGLEFKSIALQPYFNHNIFMNINPGSKKGYWIFSSNNHYDMDIKSLLNKNPDIIILSLKQQNVIKTPLIRGFKIIALFDGDLFWKDNYFEAEDYVIYKRIGIQ